MSRLPIPDTVLDERLFFGGTSGSGKTYNAMGRVERLLDKRARIVICDPLGVWWGLRLLADGRTPSGYDVVIFGGPHGDLPLTEHVGALIGETVSGMKESCIIDLSQLGTKAAERRFMLDFLTALNRHATGDPLHIVFDEADILAPQSLVGEKDGPAPRLLGMMETIVRRGRVKGFIPWLISQRPAVLNKNVLSQADGVVAFKLTSTQDRDAIGGWVEGQADKAVWNKMYGDLATMARGQGIVWIPGNGILETVQFPEKKTFDSSRTPKRGEKRAHADLKPIDLGKLKERLGKVEAEAKANDPAKLRAEMAKANATIRQLEQKLSVALPAMHALPDPAKLKVEYEKGYAAGVSWAYDSYVDRIRQGLVRVTAEMDDFAKALMVAPKAPAPKFQPTVTKPPASVAPGPVRMSTAPAPQRGNGHDTGHRPPAQQRLLDALAYLHGINIEAPSRAQLALWAGVSPNSGSYFNNLGALRTAGLIDYPPGSRVCLTAEGREQANEAPAQTQEEMQAAVLAKLPPAKSSILRAVIDEYPNSITRDALADKIGVSSNSGSYFNNLGALRTLGVIDYPQKGTVAAQPILFLE